ncbi:diacylglycerol kinase eta-like [Anastrepha ludens]|uniref:diacylglycerol kinase eta-like n=1 Tax=Anastrepha ludens TaxID=28586 RepID=UPI0023AF8511|nr:diacylglycerol kinase eta-like [Anastrepha ludens]
MSNFKDTLHVGPYYRSVAPSGSRGLAAAAAAAFGRGSTTSSGRNSACSSGSVSPIPIIAISTGDESSESEIEAEPVRIFHRRLSTKRNITTTATIKEGFLMKQTWSFQRWRRRYFRLKQNKLYYAKDLKVSKVFYAKCAIFLVFYLNIFCRDKRDASGRGFLAIILKRN